MGKNLSSGKEFPNIIESKIGAVVGGPGTIIETNESEYAGSPKKDIMQYQGKIPATLDNISIRFRRDR